MMTYRLITVRAAMACLAAAAVAATAWPCIAAETGTRAGPALRLTAMASDPTSSQSAIRNPQSAMSSWGDRPPVADASFFPLAVWLQDPRNAERYKAAGINIYVGLWQGPTEAQLAALKAAGMRVVCEQNAVAVRHLDDRDIIAWMHGDEPDNAQSLPGGKGYGPPITPERIVAGYEKMHQADPSRPVMLNLGQGVAWDGWIGRGVRTNHPEDYPEYIKGGDIISFDIYPVAHDNKAVQGNLWYVAQGVERLAKWAAGHKQIWNCIECTKISSDRKATPAQVKAEVWMSFIHGSQGIIYFVHEFKPKFNERALLDDPEMLTAVTAINKEIASLAPVLNNATIVDGVSVQSSKPEVPVRAMVKRAEGMWYVFAVAMRPGEARATFTVPNLPAGAAIEVIGEGRNLKPSGPREFEDAFGSYGVHLYRMPTAK